MKEKLKSIELINPLHLELVDNGFGEFPDSYKLTEQGIKHILEILKDNLNILEVIKGEIELAEEPKEYSEKIILDSIKTLIRNYERK